MYYMCNQYECCVNVTRGYLKGLQRVINGNTFLISCIFNNLVKVVLKLMSQSSYAVGVSIFTNIIATIYIIINRFSKANLIHIDQVMLRSRSN